MKRGHLILLIVLIVIGLLLFVMNWDYVEVRVPFVSMRMPAAILVLISAAIGFVAGLVTALVRKRK